MNSRPTNGTRARLQSTIAVEPLLGAANVTLLTGRKVKRLETDAAGRVVTAVVCETPQGEERWSGDLVVLAAGATWLVTGANRGWTKTSVPVKTLDPVTEIEGIS